MVTNRALTLRDGRRLMVHDAGATGGLRGLVVVWHHGSPQTGAILEPLLAAARERAIRLVSYGRPSYGGSSPNRGRDVASAAADVEQAADALRIDRFATMGASGGGPHALACAALLPDRVVGAVAIASPSPFTHDVDWYGGMVAPGGLRAAEDGRASRERYAATDTFDENSFTPADWTALAGSWASLGQDAGKAGSAGPEGLVDDDLAFVAPWGFDPAGITVPVLLVQGGQDRVIPPAHADRLLGSIPSAQLWLRPLDGHVSVLDACPVAMDWLRALPRPGGARAA